MLGAVPFSASSYATVTVPSYATATGLQGTYLTGVAAIKAGQTFGVSGVRVDIRTGAVSIRAGQSVSVGAVFAAFSTGTSTATGRASAHPQGLQGAYLTGVAVIKAGQTFGVSGVQLQATQGFAQARTAQRIGVSGVQARFDAGITLVWSDILTGGASPWADVFPRPTPTGSAGVYGGAPYASIAYSGQLDGVLQYDQDDDWQDVAVADSSPWRDIIL
jgi:hypothetical protein